MKSTLRLLLARARVQAFGCSQAPLWLDGGLFSVAGYAATAGGWPQGLSVPLGVLVSFK